MGRCKGRCNSMGRCNSVIVWVGIGVGVIVRVEL
jgi:hypothetical protein